MTNYKELEDRIGYRFSDESLLRRALTHPSCSGVPNYERLEFLGDAVLELIVSDELFHRCAGSPEGTLTQRRAEIVCSKSLAAVARSIDLGRYIVLGKGEEESGGRGKTSILENVTEAVLGAVYEDGGYESANGVVLRLFSGLLGRAAHGTMDQDYKSQFQELVQRTVRQEISYRVARQEGPPHRTVFYVELLLGGRVIRDGSGNSKKEAEQNAAKSALADFEKIYKG